MLFTSKVIFLPEKGGDMGPSIKSPWSFSLYQPGNFPKTFALLKIIIRLLAGLPTILQRHFERKTGESARGHAV